MIKAEQKREAKRRKITGAARNSQRPNSWLTRPETSKVDEQDVSIRDTESTPQLVEVNSFNNSTNEENPDTTKDRSDAKQESRLSHHYCKLRDQESNYCSRSQTT